VDVADGGVERAPQVMLNLPIWNVPSLLREDCPAALRRRAQRTPDGWGALVLNLVIDADDLGELPRYAQVVARYEGPLEEGGAAFVSLLPGDGPSRPGLAKLSVSSHTRARGWFGLERAAYRERKAAAGDCLLAAARRMVPDLDRRVRHQDLATPVTFKRFTGRALGMVGGVPQTPGRANFGANSHRAGPDGLWLCGDTVFPGQGTIGVTLSGLNAFHAMHELLASQGRKRWTSKATALPSAAAPVLNL
jgi:phytoene dehydrogenase-like protein